MSNNGSAAQHSLRQVETGPAAAMADSPCTDEMYCSACGRIIKRAAVHCVHCGVATPSGLAMGMASAAVPRGRKRKRVALVLALFFGHWAWCYTIAKDWWRFVICLVLQVVLIGFASAMVACAGGFSGDAGGFSVLFAIILFFVCWLWPVIHTGLRRPEFYYQDYPQTE